jgi:hypothetical protein
VKNWVLAMDEKVKPAQEEAKNNMAEDAASQKMDSISPRYSRGN